MKGIDNGSVGGETSSPDIKDRIVDNKDTPPDASE
jgi:hypothetical protein